MDKRQLAAILQIRQERRANDPLLNFKPHAKQAAFIESVLKGIKQENWFVAANRAGKSDAGAYVGATLARFGDQSDNVRFVGGKGSTIQVRDRATSGWVVSLDFPSSRDIIQPKYFDNEHVPPGSTHQPFIPNHEIAHWNKSDQVLKLKNGSIIGFKSADSGRKKFQGTEKDWIQFDEEPPKEIYEESIIRVGSYPLRVFGTCTLLPPEGQVGGVTWIYQEILKPFMAGKDTIGCFGASIYDNPHIPPSEIKRLEGLYPEGSVQRRIRLNGEWLPGLGGSRAYSAFSQSYNVSPQPPIVLRRPLCWIWDFNVEPMITLVGQRDGKLFRVFQELVLEEGNIPEMCEYFRSKYPRHLAEVWIYGDATGQKRSEQSNKSNYSIIQNNMLSYPTPVRLKIPSANPPVPERINAVNRACKNEYGEHWLSIDPSCTELIADLEQVLFDKRQGIKKTTNKKDPYFRRTHSSDGLGYWIAFEEPVVRVTNPDTLVPLVTSIRQPSYKSSKRG